MKKITYQLYSASGNPTAIIYGFYSRDVKDKINKKIFNSNSLVEQIGYLYEKNGRSYFEMMGNEFSGNGCRAAGYLLLNNKDGTIKFKTSGIDKEVEVNIKNNNSTLTLPYSFNKKKIIKNDFGFLIKLFGSYIFVFEEKVNLLKIKAIIKTYQDKKAVGIMFINQLNNKKVVLNPYFYVKETNTLVNETSCGSGSVATGIYLSWKNKQSCKNLEIIQPSKESIFYSSNYQNNKIKNIKISGPTNKLGNYKINFPSLRESKI